MTRVKKSSIGSLAVIFLFVAAPPESQAAERGTQADGQEISVTADSLSLEESGRRIEAKGNVEIKRQQTTLRANEVQVNRDTQDVSAQGNISVDDPEWKVKSAESLQLNMEKETGEIQKADLFIEQGHISISGRRFQKFGGQTYHIDDGFFTTCLCESGPPSWKFSAEQIDLTLAGSGSLSKGWFYVLDYPVFYLPYAVFPLRTERQTGFLFPKFGQSSREGFRFQQPFFWAISKSSDATVSFDAESRARLGVLGEFRKLFSQDSDLQLHSSYFNEKLRRNEQDDIVDRTIADQRIPTNRWSVAGTHRYPIGSNWLTYSDVSAYSDDLFARELSERFDLSAAQESNIRVSRFARSRFGVFRSWGDSYLQGDWRFYQDFIQEDKTTLQRTPQLAFWGRRFGQNSPLELRWTAQAVNYLRREGGDGLRLDLRPEVIAPFRFASYLFGSLSVAPRETVYHLYSPVKSSDRNVSRELVEIRGNIGTSLSRVFAWNTANLSAVKHVIEPELSYLFVPRTDQSRIPIMDGIDRVNRRNVVTLAVTNRVWGKFPSPLTETGEDRDVELLNPVDTSNVRGLGSLKLALSYDVDKERKGGDSLSDVDMNLRVTPTSYLTLGFDGGVNPGPWQMTQLRLTFAISDPRPIARRVLDPDFSQPNSLSMGYHFLRRGPNAFLAEDANIDLDAPANCALHPLDPRCPGTGFDKNVVGNLVGTLRYRATDNLLFQFSSNYDVRDTRFIGFRAATKVLSSCECWAMTFTFKQAVNPSKSSFNFDFNLLGLGSQRSTLR
jgi:LPS-assembly protein